MLVVCYMDKATNAWHRQGTHVLDVQRGCTCRGVAKAGLLSGIFVSLCCFVLPRCGFTLAHFCNYLRGLPGLGLER